MKLLLGLVLGAAFGAMLQLSGASSHTKITNTLRLKDLTVMKVILTAIGVGLFGVHMLDAAGWAHMKVKDLYLPGMALAGGIFGVGFAEGKPDAWATVLGGLVGALVFAFMFPELEGHLLSMGQFGPVTVQGVLGIQGIWLAAPLAAGCLYLAWRLPGAGGTR
jgi:uncharacterized protein